MTRVMETQPLQQYFLRDVRAQEQKTPSMPTSVGNLLPFLPSFYIYLLG